MTPLLSLCAGLATGTLLFLTQLRTVNRLQPNTAPNVILPVLLQTIARLALAALLLLATLQHGLLPALLATAGLLSSRWLGFAWLAQNEWQGVRG